MFGFNRILRELYKSNVNYDKLFLGIPTAENNVIVRFPEFILFNFPSKYLDLTIRKNADHVTSIR